MDYLFVVAYVDQILNDGKTFEDHWFNFQQVLFVLRNEKSYANLGTYEFTMEHGTFLGYVVIFQRFQVGANMVQAIKDWLISKCTFEERSFHEFTRFYKNFIKYLSTITSLLVDVPKKMSDFTWKICLHLIKFASNQAYHSPMLYSALEVDYSFKLIISISLDLIPYSDHALNLGDKNIRQASKLLIIYTINKDYSGEQLGCEK
ncbi:hypothetical protein M9H77_08718 [Catharanthus roseus]|uniref:Uncharacterized protein n=1 Tax=Catharanthus roseus TaxID=4058 RepID=A0ACC0BYJ4_CATRO|nr:hypothetical protein M9H77_08718 [Catharanthus roseus]